MQELESLLKELGLTEYESKAYLVLLGCDMCTAEVISASGRIPLPRVYDTMQTLAKKGLVIVTKSRPQKFKAVDPVKFFDILKDDEKKTYEMKVKSIGDIKTKFMVEEKKIPKMNVKDVDDDYVAYVKKKANMDKIRSEFIMQAKNEVLIFSGDLSWIEKPDDIIKKIAKGRIDIKVLWQCSDKKIPKVLRLAKKYKIEFRYCPSIGSLRAIIIDGRKVSIAIKDVVRDGIKEYTTVTIGNDIIIDVFRKYFLTLWEKAMPLEKYLRQAE